MEKKKAVTTKTTESKKVVGKKPAPKKPAPKTAAVEKPVKAVKAVKEVVKKPVKRAAKKPPAVKVLYAASEAFPFAGTGGLGEVIGSLPKAVKAKIFDARVMIPYYKDIIPAEYSSKFKFLTSFNVQLSWRSLYCGIFEYVHEGVTYYFLDNEYYFKRNAVYGFYDDGERFAFFSKAVVEALCLIDFIPDALHANDWQTALIPVYYKLYFMHGRRGYGNIKTVFTVHNIEYQGKFGRDSVEDLFGISKQEVSSLEYDGCINLVKAAMDYSDAVTTVSPTYAEELKTPAFAHGLSEIVRWNSNKLTGIINGIDYESYNPETDDALFAKYGAASFNKKAENKVQLQRMLGLAEDKNIPMVGLVTRLVQHKGMDLLKQAVHDILKQNVQIVLLGKGDADYENYFTYIERNYEKKFKAVIAFNRDLSRKFYGGADIFLMPSKTEPCGLAQMIACRYGTVPVVHETGGLFDTVKDCGAGGGGNGFTFARYDAEDLTGAVTRAVSFYNNDRAGFAALAKRVMSLDFSWGNSAAAYAEFYNKLCDRE